MIVLPLVPQTLKLEFHWTYGTDANVMSHLFYNTGGGTPGTTDLQGFVNLAATSYGTNMASQAHTTVALRKVRGIWLGDRTSAVPEWNGNTAGTRAATSLPAQTCMLYNLRIPRRYRGGKPRVYFPLGNAVDIADPQHWSAAFITSSTTAINTINNALQAYTSTTFSTPALASVSYYSGGSLRASPVVDFVSSIAANAIPGSQRRRIRP